MTFDETDAEVACNDFIERGDVPICGLRRIARWSVGEAASPNAIIQGDNLDVMRMLASSSPATIKCAYLDPPYNNGDSYRHYHDSMDHAAWLSAVVTRLELVKHLLRLDGSAWISIDDSELHYLKVAADGVFGRANFIGTVVWERRTTRENRRVLSRNHEYLLVYAKDASRWAKVRNGDALTEEVRQRYRNPDNDPRGDWQSVSANVQDGHSTPQQYFPVVSPSGRIHHPPKGRCWAYNARKFSSEVEKNNIWFGRNGDGAPRIKSFLHERTGGMTPETLWRATDAGTTTQAKKELISLFREEALFDTPKPEQLVHRILSISTNPGDLVLDPYLGSGTTAAVAHKMGRHYIGIESGEHAKTHCMRRIRAVAAGEPGGVSGVVGWRGGGSCSFYQARATRGQGI